MLHIKYIVAPEFRVRGSQKFVLISKRCMILMAALWFVLCIYRLEVVFDQNI